MKTIRILFRGARYTTSVVIKDASGNHFKTFGPQPLGGGSGYYIQDARDGVAAGVYTGTHQLTALDGGDGYTVTNKTFEWTGDMPDGDYSVQMYCGSHPTYYGAPTVVTIYDDNSSFEDPIAQVEGNGTAYDSTYHNLTMGGISILIDITYGGQLSGVRAFDHNDSVFCYIAEESEAPSVYFGTDLSDFASFEKKTIINESSQPMVLEGKPVSLSMKSDDGSIYLGTRSGKLYHVAYNAGSNCVAQELFSASGYVSGVHWDSYRSECLFEVGGVIRSVDLSGTVSVKHTLAAGSMVEDFKAAPSGVAIVFRKADFTFEVMFVEGANWASPKAPSQMIESVRAARDFEYNSDLDMWVAAAADGSTSATDLLL